MACAAEVVWVQTPSFQGLTYGPLQPRSWADPLGVGTKRLPEENNIDDAFQDELVMVISTPFVPWECVNNIFWFCVPEVEVNEILEACHSSPAGPNTVEQKVISRPIRDLPTGLGDPQAFISSFFSAALFLLSY
ncbi:hypothetical protein MTR67_012105 [Solanum verrucosum]|uniref:Uncharacterized protein n=1 Tax=Solanum verrucosum TaxID=315347 RepID=A0AAF0QCD1_SOLVR|nr:hypothetical protein MTR67_012105 [Solanum verrucosum]